MSKPGKSEVAAAIGAVDAAIRDGDLPLARRQLARLPERGIAREARYLAASAARRANLPLLALRLLLPLVRPRRGRPSLATPRETAEYAASLTRLGAADEATALLRSIATAQAPEARLFEAFALFTRWDYAGAIAPLREYIETPLDAYARLVGEVNLAAALVLEKRTEEAARLLGALLEATRRGGHGLLHGNCLELFAQNALFARDYRAARRYLALADSALSDKNSLYALFVRKWGAIVELVDKKPSKATLRALDAVRAEARGRSHWETLRDCDRFQAVATGDAGLFLHVYFGTPYAVFRSRLASEFPSAPPVPSEYLWRLGGDGRTRCFDLVQCRELRPGGVLHRLALALSADFYRPARLATLFSRLYPTERFLVTSSPTRVHQVLHRLRAALASRQPSLSAVETADGYRWIAKGSAAIRVGLDDIEMPELMQWRLHFGEALFSVRDVERLMGLSRSAAHRRLRAAAAIGALTSQGEGKSTRYRFAKRR